MIETKERLQDILPEGLKVYPEIGADPDKKTGRWIVLFQESDLKGDLKDLVVTVPEQKCLYNLGIPERRAIKIAVACAAIAAVGALLTVKATEKFNEWQRR